MKDTNISFRQLEDKDTEQYRRIRLECLKTYPGNFGTGYLEEMEFKSLKLQKAMTAIDKRSFAFGAFALSVSLIGICGFIGEHKSRSRHRGQIVQLYVDNSYSRLGIGRKLLKLCVEKAFEDLGIELVTLGVVHENIEALNLYKQSGFKEYGRLDIYFRDEGKYSSLILLYLTRKAIIDPQ